LKIVKKNNKRNKQTYIQRAKQKDRKTKQKDRRTKQKDRKPERKNKKTERQKNKGALKHLCVL
jgi:hypothetical protein